MSKYQSRYWSMLVECRVHLSYLHHYAAQAERYDQYANMLIALTSSASIAAWAVWGVFQWLWSCAIALSQVITVIKPYLGFNKKRELSNELGDAMQVICIQIEREWYEVAEGLLTEEEIHSKTAGFNTQRADAERAILKGAILPRNEKILEKAEADVARYIETHYR